jgi:hypothetical protein
LFAYLEKNLSSSNIKPALVFSIPVANGPKVPALHV